MDMVDYVKRLNCNIPGLISLTVYEASEILKQNKDNNENNY